MEIFNIIVENDIIWKFWEVIQLVIFICLVDLSVRKYGIISIHGLLFEN